MHSPRSICLFLSPLICLLMLSIWKSEVKKDFLLRHKEFRNFALFVYLQGQEWCQHCVCVCVCVCVSMCLCVCVSVHAQSCPTLWDLIDHSLPGSSVHGIFHARILKWVAISYSRESSRPRVKLTSPVSFSLAGRFFTTVPQFVIFNKHPFFFLFLNYSWEF